MSDAVMVPREDARVKAAAVALAVEWYSAPGDTEEARSRAGTQWPGFVSMAKVAVEAALAASTPVGGSTPGGWLVKDFADGWYWTGDRLNADMAANGGACVFSIETGQYAAPPPPSVSIDSRPQEAVPTEQAEPAVVARLVDRFLSWRLPEDFNPDGGVRFDKERLHPAHWPSGTNLLDYAQATEMVRRMLAGEAA